MENWSIIKLICLDSMAFLAEWGQFKCTYQKAKDNIWDMEYLEGQEDMMKYLNGI